MKQLDFSNKEYRTLPGSASFLAGILPSFVFYCRFIGIIYSASLKAKRNIYSDAEWYKSSYDVLRVLEKIGIRFHVTGIDNYQNLEEPCVVIGNHMSMMETVVLPIILSTSRSLTFVVKESLLNYPVFKHVMRSRNPVAVTRTNARQDLKTVMEQGVQRLEQGISIVVFPQTTRSVVFDPAQMSSIGVKLAKKAGVPIVPLALQTSAWKNGNVIKDLGKIDVPRNVNFAFDVPIYVQGKGAEEHQRITDFIQTKLQEWERPSHPPAR